MTATADETMTARPDSDKKAPVNLTEVASWDGTRLVFHESAMKVLIREALSPSTAKAMSGCTARWAGERLLPRGTDPFGAAELGTSVHSILEDLYDRPFYMRSRDEALRILDGYKHKMWPGGDDATLAKAADWHGKVFNLFLNEKSGLWTIENPMQVKVADLEQGFKKTTTVRGIPFVGFIDRTDIILDEDGKPAIALRDYKGLALDTPIPTPTGWTTMGDLAVGDQVLGTEGLPVNVTIKSQVHNRPCYEITFSDGTSVICDNVHYWQVDEAIGSGRKTTSVMEADDLYARYLALTAEGRTKSLTIPNAKPLDLPEADLPLDPWLLGAWLGDGTSKAGEITVGKTDLDDMLTLIKGSWTGSVRTVENDKSVTVSLNQADRDACPYGHREFSARKTDHGARRCLPCGRDYHTGGPTETRSNVPLGTLLGDLGVRRNKHIPTAYLRAAYDQRLAVLQGLMDTDGHWNPTRERAVFVTTNAALADGLTELVSSFGLNAQRFSKSYENAVRPDATVYMVEFAAVGINPFRLPRKAVQVDEHQTRQSNRRVLAATRRVIADMRPVDSVPTQCIQVDAPDSLYLCGPTMVVTHNTGKVPKDIGRYGDDHGDQMRLYAEAYANETGTRPAEASLIYTQHGKSRVVPLSKPAMSKTLASYERAWADLKRYEADASFPTKVGPLCGWCPLVNTCPVAKAAGKEDRTGNAPKAGDMHIPVMNVIATKIPVWTGDDDDFSAHWDSEPAVAVEAAASEADDATDDTTEAPTDLPENEQGIEARNGHEPASAAHLISASTPTLEVPPMTTRIFSEDKSWFPESSGLLNANSYAAMGLFGMTSLAYEELRKANVPLKGNIDALSQTFTYIVATVQAELGNGTDTADGLNTRLRGLLRTFIDVDPIPFDSSEDVWDEWVTRAINHSRSIAKAAHRLYTEQAPAKPWSGLAVTRPAAVG